MKGDAWLPSGRRIMEMGGGAGERQQQVIIHGAGMHVLRLPTRPSWPERPTLRLCPDPRGYSVVGAKPRVTGSPAWETRSAPTGPLRSHLS
jgi:hypothetical protein